MGRYVNDGIQSLSIRLNHGIFEAENRLWACYPAVILYVTGFVMLGASLQEHLSLAALIIGWGMAQMAVMTNTVAICESYPASGGVHHRQQSSMVDAYASDCFPRNAVSNFWVSTAHRRNRKF